ncbi:hypothetical protein FRC08_004129 [Ceratobasidium sp. 394]|nr:hypothetical protein FRC08_004129 [Ceratobasidium sp. 394]
MLLNIFPLAYADILHSASTLVKSGSSQVSLQLPTPSPSPSKPQKRHQSPQIATRRDSPPPKAHRIPSPSVSSTSGSSKYGTATSSRSASEAGDVLGELNRDLVDEIEELYKAVDAPTKHGSEDQGSEDESEDESEIIESGRMTGGPMKEERNKNALNAQVEAPRWDGGQEGQILFRKRPNSNKVITPGKWTFSWNGIEQQSFKGRNVGNIHFSPVFAGGKGEYEHWVLVEDPQLCWVLSTEGHTHPMVQGYVMRPCDGTKPPQWILAQSLQANKTRAKPRYVVAK